jgi:hypothetical protein
MKQHWLDIQSFLSDQKILAAIDNLAMALQLELSGVSDAERRELGRQAAETLRAFLRRLSEVSAEAQDQLVRGVDPRFMELAGAFAAARRDRANYRSTLMRVGVEPTLGLLERDEPRAKRELLDCLRELRRIVQGHQQTDVSSILEDF